MNEGRARPEGLRRTKSSGEILVRAVVLLSCAFLLFALAGCGKGNSTSPSPNTPTPTGPANGSEQQLPAPPAPVPVTINAGQTTMANITVHTVSTSPAPLNVHLFGAVPGANASSVSAGNSVTVVRRGQSYTAFLVGDNLNSGESFVFSSSDITIDAASLQNAKPTNSDEGATGVTFTFTVNGSAVPGPRSIQVMDSNNYISLFSGAVLVTP